MTSADGTALVRPARAQDADAVLAVDRLPWTSVTSPAPAPADWTVTDAAAAVRDLLVAGLDRAQGVLRGEFVLDGRLVDDVLMARHL